MSQTTLEQAAKWVAEAAGLDFPRQCDRVLELTNDVRELLYQESSLVWNATICAPVRCFCRECGNACSTSWSGVSLPAWMRNVLSVWVDDRPVPTVDRWGIYPYEAEWNSRQTWQAVDMGTGYPFMVDPLCSECFMLGFLARAKADIGKTIEVRFVDSNDIPRTETFTLDTKWACLRYKVKYVLPDGISLPINLAGQIVAKDGNGTTLAEWQKWETVPSYRRIKLPLGCCNAGKMISIHGEREFYRLYHLADVVETNSKLIWEDGYKHLLLHRKTEADKGDIANAARFASAFKARVETEARKSWGRTKRLALRIAPKGRRSGLLSKQ